MTARIAKGNKGMPKIGNIRDNGYRGQQVFVACISCGKGRWVNLRKGEPRSLRCRSCAKIKQWQNLAYREKQRLAWENPAERKKEGKTTTRLTETDRNKIKESYLVKRLAASETAQQLGYGLDAVYYALRKLGIIRSQSEAAKLWHSNHINYNWKGGRYKEKRGYIQVLLQPNDFFYPMADKRSYVFEHRLVMAKHLGRCLEHWEIVHHKNRIRGDNRIENLELHPSQVSHYSTSLMQQKIKECEKEIRLLKWQVKMLTNRINQAGLDLPKEIKEVSNDG